MAGEKCTTPAPVILSITDSDTDEDAAPMMASAFCASSLSTDCEAMLVVVSPRVRVELLHGLAEHAAGLVDLLESEVDARELGRAEERQRTGLGQQRAEGQRAITLRRGRG
ncbi:hypothetical protein GCM10020220_014200 [Nonomuraea rubra]